MPVGSPRGSSDSFRPVFCPHCGARNEQSWRYCSECGRDLPAAEAADPAEGGRVDGRFDRLVGMSRRERLITAATGLALAVAIAAAAVLLLGGDDEEDRYVERMDELCIESKQALGVLAEELPSAGGAAAGSVYGAAAAELVVGWRSEAEVLETPAELQPAAAELGRALGELEFAMRSLAGPTGDIEGAVGGSISELEVAIEGLELTGCAGIGITLPS